MLKRFHRQDLKINRPGVSIPIPTWMGVYDAEGPETPNDSRIISEDVSRGISRCIFTGIQGELNKMLV